MASTHRLRVLSALSAALLAAFTIVSCTSPSAPKPAAEPEKSSIKIGGALRFAVERDPSSMDPHTGQSGGDHKFFWSVFDNLVAYNQQGVPDPSISLAESWDVKDPKRIVFKLRQGVKFHDGTPFDAAAVKWNIERQQDPATKGAARAQLLPIKQMEVLDSNTIAFNLDAPNSALLNLLGDRGGAMISPEAAKKHGAQFGRNPVGTGPFKFVEWVQNDRLVVERNPDYWGKDKDGNKLPYLDKVVFKFIPERAVRLASTEAGEVDLTDVDTAEWDRLEKEGKLAYVDFSGASTRALYLNESLPPLDKVEVRRALLLATDAESLNKALYRGKYPLATSFTTPAQFTYIKEMKNAPKYDLKQAQELMAKVNLPPSARKLTIVVMPSDQPGAEILQAAYGKIGLEVEVQTLAGGETTNKMFVERTVHGYFSGFSIRSDPDGSVREVFHSEGFYNAGHQKNPELDGLIEKAVQTYDIGERKRIYSEAQDIIAKDAHSIYYAYSVSRQAGNKKVQNLKTLFGAEGKERFKELWLAQ